MPRPSPNPLRDTPSPLRVRLRVHPGCAPPLAPCRGRRAWRPVPWGHPASTPFGAPPLAPCRGRSGAGRRGRRGVEGEARCPPACPARWPAGQLVLCRVNAQCVGLALNLLYAVGVLEWELPGEISPWLLSGLLGPIPWWPEGWPTSSWRWRASRRAAEWRRQRPPSSSDDHDPPLADRQRGAGASRLDSPCGAGPRSGPMGEDHAPAPASSGYGRRLQCGLQPGRAFRLGAPRDPHPVDLIRRVGIRRRDVAGCLLLTALARGAGRFLAGEGPAAP